MKNLDKIFGKGWEDNDELLQTIQDKALGKLTKFELLTFRGKPNKKEKGFIKTNNYTMEVQRTIRKGLGDLNLQRYLQNNMEEARATGN